MARRAGRSRRARLVRAGRRLGRARAPSADGRAGVDDRHFRARLEHDARARGRAARPFLDAAARRRRCRCVAEAVTRIHGMPIEQRLEGGPALGMMRALAPELSLTNRMAVSNEWLFGPLLRQRMAGNPAAQRAAGHHGCADHDRWRRPAQRVAGRSDGDDQFPHPSARQRRRSCCAARARRWPILDGVTVEWAEEPRDASADLEHDIVQLRVCIAALSRDMLPDAPVAPGLGAGGHGFAALRRGRGERVSLPADLADGGRSRRCRTG